MLVIKGDFYRLLDRNSVSRIVNLALHLKKLTELLFVFCIKCLICRLKYRWVEYFVSL